MIKEFNTYLANVDSDFWSRLIIEYGSLRIYKKGEEFIEIGNVGRYIGLIKSGSVKYVAYTSHLDEKIVGLETVDGFAASWPFCLNDIPSLVSIITNEDSEIYCLSVSKLKDLAKNNPEVSGQIAQSTEQVFYTAYKRLISFYIQSPKERYDNLLEKCPRIFEIFDLKDIASFLNITPIYLSRIRKKMKEIKKK